MAKKQEQVLLAFGKTVRDRRVELGISQEEFAERANLHRTYVSSLERGKRNSAFLNLIKVAQALELTPEEFIVKVARNMPNGSLKI